MSDVLLPTQQSNKGNYSYAPLQIELIPTSATCKDITEHFSEQQWYYISSQVYNRAKNTCEICKSSPVEHIHTVWLYHKDANMQEFYKLFALCSKCYLSKHTGLISDTNELEQVIQHLCEVNNFTRKQAIAQIENAFNNWNKLSNHELVLSLQKIQQMQLWADKQIAQQENTPNV